MKKFVSALSVMLVCGGFVSKSAWGITTTFGSKALSYALTGYMTDDVCALPEFKEKDFKSNCGKVGDNCTPESGTNGKCVQFKNGSLRCAAQSCEAGKLMPLVFHNKDDAQKQQNALISGYCHTKQEAENICTNACDDTCKISDGDKCVPYVIDSSKANGMLRKSQGVVKLIGGKAYAACHCDKKEEPKKEPDKCTEGNCYWRGSIIVTCSDTKTEILQNVSIQVKDKDVSKEEIVKLGLEQYKDKIDEMCGTESSGVKVEVKDNNGFSGSAGDSDATWRNQSGGSTAGNGDGNDANVSGAYNRVSEFFKKIDSDRSVWKNADGSFNGVRLASDLTAGVVLGTVGGVVSGVLIKKAQVEKGFDALNCSVGGQKIADWGDEFRVGLRW